MKKPIAWCITVGKGHNAYIMDNKTFDRKRDAIAYRKSQPQCSWSHHWHISKIQGEKM